MRRRTFLQTSLAATVCALHSPGPASPVETETLRGAGDPRNLFVGSAVSTGQLREPLFSKLIAEQCSIVVAENAMKWGIVHPEVDRYDFLQPDLLLHFAGDNALRVRGHNLCWHRQQPPWFEKLGTTTNAAKFLQDHIHAVAGRYAGRIHSWDVVNEAILIEDGREDGLRTSNWFKLLGRDYISIAFRTAAETDPKALLTYNDYDLEDDTPYHAKRRAATLGLLRWMRDTHVPIHAVGLQSHMKARREGKPHWEPFHEFLNQVAQLELQLFVTEFDMNDKELPADIQARDAQVAALGKDYLQNVLQHPQLRAVLTWGLSDRDTWLTGFDKRDDGLPQRPLPFDENLKPAPLFHAMLEALHPQ